MEPQPKCIICDTPDIDQTLQIDCVCCKPCYEQMIKQFVEYKEEQIKNNQLDPCISEIIKDKLYLGNEDGAYVLKQLKDRNITHILIAGSFMKALFQDQFEYKIVEVQDSLQSKLIPYFQECNNFIENGKCVYVHCAAGINRSATFVIAYLMNKNKWSYEDTFQFVREKRNIIGRNSNFVEQLKAYQQQLGIKDNEIQEDQ